MLNGKAIYDLAMVKAGRDALKFNISQRLCCFHR